MEANHLRPSLFEPHILDWQDLCGGPLDIVTHYIYEPHGFSHYMYKSMGATDPSGKDSLDPRGLIGRIYIATYMNYIHV